MKSTKTSKLIVFKIYHYHISNSKFLCSNILWITQKTLKLSSRKFPYNTLLDSSKIIKIMMNHENWFKSWKFSTTEGRSYTVYDMYKIWQQPVTPAKESMKNKSVTIKASLQVLKRLRQIAILLYICMPKGRG